MAAEIQPANPAHTNRLAREKSPYLLQHAHNPVDWYPWGEEAFAKARRENKPIFLSIGYSTCHWCHVMAHESFENEETAEIMNREFVNIKVDREERPDVDRVYMTFVQRTTGGGGWPMSVWLTPDLKPFVGGTYFPPVDRYGQPAFKKVLDRIAAAWKADRTKISEQGEKIISALRGATAAFGQTGKELDSEVMQTAYEQFARTFDPGEGAFYVWTNAEIGEALGKAAEIFAVHYGIEGNGNAPTGSDPHGEFTGKNILIERHSIAETASRFGKTEKETGRFLAKARAKLFANRAERPRPHLDDKIITAWNGLMISAFARGAEVLSDKTYLETATRAAEFLQIHLYDASRKVLTRNFREGRGVDGFADDYAFFIQALLDLYETSFEIKWLKFALELQSSFDAQFLDATHGGYFTVTGRDPSILFRMKEDNDSAEPAASSIAALNLAQLAAMQSDSQLLMRAKQTISAFASQLTNFPSALPQMLVAVDFLQGPPRQIVIAGAKNDQQSGALIAEVRRHFLPRTILLLADGGAGQKFLSEINTSLSAMVPVNGEPAVYVCENFACRAPVTDLRELAQILTQ